MRMKMRAHELCFSIRYGCIYKTEFVLCIEWNRSNVDVYIRLYLSPCVYVYLSVYLSAHMMFVAVVLSQKLLSFAFLAISLLVPLWICKCCCFLSLSRLLASFHSVIVWRCFCIKQASKQITYTHTQRRPSFKYTHIEMLLLLILLLLLLLAFMLLHD